MKNTVKISIVFILLLASFNLFAQGDHVMQTTANVQISWRIVSDFQPAGATCFGYTYHIFIDNLNPFPVIISKNQVYQNASDGTSCWQNGFINLGGLVIPAGKWNEYTFRVTCSPNYIPGAPGLTNSFTWQSNQPTKSNY